MELECFVRYSMEEDSFERSTGGEEKDSGGKEERKPGGNRRTEPFQAKPPPPRGVPQSPAPSSPFFASLPKVPPRPHRIAGTIIRSSSPIQEKQLVHLWPPRDYPKVRSPRRGRSKGRSGRSNYTVWGRAQHLEHSGRSHCLIQILSQFGCFWRLTGRKASQQCSQKSWADADFNKLRPELIHGADCERAAMLLLDVLRD
ncbi:hypothetical protein Nepgr_019877 [Nepenthes gracilis]|uniref:Uncharacterized protein n=1 Tax=Nepenthes gracilis TaxID=150966 RepID=A0AAD3SXW2_NEPGR|nr:hypothetical protein Nepgr_019877 [Nepenthes gracilis]